jgi:uncharacterized membrane protein YgcG
MPLASSKRLSLTARLFLPPFAFFLFSFALAANAEKIQDIHPTSYVTDLAHIIAPDSKTRLENLCLELEQKTGAQMAIVTILSLDGQDVDQYGNDLFKQLGVGNKKDNRGVLLLVAPTDRKYRVEVSYGLEPVINDARAGDAGRLMRSYFLQGSSRNSSPTIAASRSLQRLRPGRSARARTIPGLSPSGRFLFSFSS